MSGAVASLITNKHSISTLVWSITNMAVVTSHISPRGDLAVAWTWLRAASLVFEPVVLCYFFPRAVTHFVSAIYVPVYLLVSTLPSLTGTAEDEEKHKFQLHLGLSDWLIGASFE